MQYGVQIESGRPVEQDHGQGQLREHSEALRVGLYPQPAQAVSTQRHPICHEYQCRCDVPAPDKARNQRIAQHDDAKQERGLVIH